jgi:hypothetical protein
LGRPQDQDDRIVDLERRVSGKPCGPAVAGPPPAKGSIVLDANVTKPAGTGGPLLS